jgi:tetratricopeptide (TPR) repeat protein
MFLAYKDRVEMEYSANYIDNDSSIKILQNPPGVYFVHYVVEIMKFSMQQYQDKYSTHLKINGNVSDSEGKTIYQYEGSISVELDEDQLKSIAYKPFDIYDMFPLTAGSYKFSVIIKNEVSKEFTTVEKDIIIPEDDSAPGMSSLVLGYKMEQASPETQNLKAFKFGSFQILHQPKTIFRRQDTLFLAFQITGLSPDLRQKGRLKYEFFKDDEPFYNFTRKGNQYEGGVNFRHEFSLQEFPPGYYRLRVGLWDGEQEILAEEEKFAISPVSVFPRPWIHTKTLPPPDHPVYSFLLGKQLFSKGEVNRAQAKLEEAFEKKPDSLDFALNLAQVYSVQKKHHQVKQVLLAFSDGSEVPYQLYFLLGKSHQALGEFDQAIAVYKKALSHYGINSNLLNSIGECYYHLGMWDEALAAWEKSLEINDRQPDVEEKVKNLKKIDLSEIEDSLFPRTSSLKNGPASVVAVIGAAPAPGDSRPRAQDIGHSSLAVVLNPRYLVPIRRETRAGLHDIRNWHLPLVDETPHELGGAGNGFQEIQVDVPQLQRAGLVVGGRDNQGFPVRLGEVEGQLDALIELERLGDYARDVTVDRHPVDGAALDHEEEPVRILAQDFDRLSGHLGQGG